MAQMAAATTGDRIHRIVSKAMMPRVPLQGRDLKLELVSLAKEAIWAGECISEMKREAGRRCRA